MKDISKPIRLSEHAKEQLTYRGTNKDERAEAIHKAKWKSAELNRMECQYEFLFEKVWNKKFYSKKHVRPIFVEEKDEIVVITVYVYYF